MASLFKRKSSPYWYLRYVNAAGRVIQESTETKDFKVAKQKKLKVEYELTTGKNVIGGVPLFSEYVETYLAWHEHEFPDSHERVKQICEDHLTHEFGHRQLDQIDKLMAKS